MILAVMMITCCRFTNLKAKDGLTELSLPKIQTDMLKDYDRQVFFLQSMVTPISIYVSVCVWKENNHWTLAFLVIRFLHICGGGDMARNLSPSPPLHREKSSHQKMDSFKIMIFIHHCTSLLFRWRQIHPRCDKQCVQHTEKLGFGCKDLKTKHRMATTLLCIN